MKKIIFLLSMVICGIDFSAACKWISNKPTYYEKKMIELIESKKLGNRIYCDSENDKMVYQMLNKDGHSELLFDYIDKFERDVKKLLPLNLNDRDYDFAPRNYNYRMYIYFPDSKDTYMVMKKVVDLRELEFYSFYSEEFFLKEDSHENEIRKIFEENETYPTNDIIY